MKSAIKAPLFLNVAFRVVKGGLLQYEKRALGLPNAAFRKIVGIRVFYKGYRTLDECIECRPFQHPVLQEGKVDGAILASPVTDTLKIVNTASIIEQTVSRDFYRAAQSPQGFRAESLMNALADRLNSATDEASAMEAIGAKIAVIDSPSSNIKVTHPDDAILAKFFLQSIKGASL